MQQNYFMLFTSLPLHKTIQKALVDCNYKQTTKVQENTIPLVIESKDVMVSAQTGTGKTAAFSLPIIDKIHRLGESSKGSKRVKALILSPTRELAEQIYQNILLYTKYTNVRAAVVYGGTSIGPQIDQIVKGIDILIATPGRLLDLHKREVIYLNEVETFVLDEADLMLDMGFLPDVAKVERLCPEDRQNLLFSATLPNKVRDLASVFMQNPELVEIAPTSSVVKTIEQYLYYVPKRNKIELGLHLLRNTIKGRVIIFRRTKFGVEKLTKTLEKNNYTVDSIHGDKSQTARQEALQRFKDKKVQILIATDVASRGIDITGVDVVFNFDLPNIPETYVHRVGRTGRAGETGLAYSLCSADEKSYVISIQKLIQNTLTVVEDHPYPLDPKAKPIVHTSNEKKSKYKKGRKSEASKKKKKRWY